MRYQCYLEQDPTLASFRLDHVPFAGYAPVFICPFIVFTDSAGNMYNAMRGIMGESRGTAMNYGIYKLNGVLDEQCPMYTSYKDFPVNEPYRVTETDDAVTFLGDSFQFDFGVDHYVWNDFGGRLQTRSERLGQICSWWVPEQPGFDHPQLLRSHLGKLTGTLDGEPIEGMFMLDYIYSHSHAMWKEMGMLTKVHNLWLNWLVEYEDGSLEGGYTWRGRPGTDFAATHHFVDGRSWARTDSVIALEHTDRGTVSGVTIDLGTDTSMRLHQVGSLDWPLHTLGTVEVTKGVNAGKKVVKSWNYTEYFPLNWGAVADYQSAHNQLFGRYPSFQRLMQGARVDENQLLVFDQQR
jgi:hypothetical protein